MEKRIGIVGAGISGLLACKYALSKGFKPIVFEAKDTIGGVWIKTIETTKLQTPKVVYQFSDFPWPESVAEMFPDQQQVLAYLRSYADHFGLLDHVKLNTEVLGINFRGPPDDEMQGWRLWGGAGEPFGPGRKWDVHVHDTRTLETKVYEVDFVILCVGRFSDIPNVPEFPTGEGPEAFRGEVMHSMEYSNMDNDSARGLVKGKRVTVVGFQKSALDIAMECSTLNGVEAPCRVLYRTEHWNLPDYLPWGVPLSSLYLNRFSELMVHKPGEGLLLSILAYLLAPLRWAASKFVESYIKSKLRLAKFGMVPNHSFLQQLSSCLVSTVPEKFYDRVEEGSILLKKAPNSFGFYEDGIVVHGDEKGTTLQETDLVILATGFRGDEKIKHMFRDTSFRDSILGSPSAAAPLYRQCIHPRVPHLAVIGFSESVANLYTSEIRCRWVAELLDGRLKLPSIREMEKEVDDWDAYMKRSSGDYYRRSCIGALHIWYNDQICKDMGWKPYRKNGFFAELFQPYGPTDYVSP